MKMLSKVAVLTIIGLLFRVPAVQSQSEPTVPATIGTRVRIFAPDLRTDRYVGRIQKLDDAVVVLDTGEVRSMLGLGGGPVLVDEYRRVTIRLATIESVEVSRGRTAGGSTIKGVLLGALVGGVLIAAGSLPEVNPNANDFLRAVPRGALIGAVVGGGIGWGMGSERWIPARIPR